MNQTMRADSPSFQKREAPTLWLTGLIAEAHWAARTHKITNPSLQLTLEYVVRTKTPGFEAEITTLFLWDADISYLISLNQSDGNYGDSARELPREFVKSQSKSWFLHSIKRTGGNRYGSSAATMQADKKDSEQDKICPNNYLDAMLHAAQGDTVQVPPHPDHY